MTDKNNQNIDELEDEFFEDEDEDGDLDDVKYYGIQKIKPGRKIDTNIKRKTNKPGGKSRRDDYD